jgi:coenzyme F420-reducing hydrogenase gamma subunit
MVARGVPCLGPVTHAGCGALCPAYDRGCYGCYGPAAQPNLVSLTGQFRADGLSNEESVRFLRSFNGYAPEFRAESERLAAQK